MSTPREKNDREDKALQALISATLHVEDVPVTEKEIEKHLGKSLALSTEDEEALRRLGPNPLQSVVKAPLNKPQDTEAQIVAALNRKKPEGGFSARTEQQIQAKREELLAKLRQKRGGH
jgi:hypothetical protein